MTEQLVSVYDDTKGHGRCRACDARLTWYTTIAGKKMPFDGDPVGRDSKLDDDRRLIVRVPADDVHWRTCPEADTFRRPR